jgi:hypothetical protein
LNKPANFNEKKLSRRSLLQRGAYAAGAIGVMGTVGTEPAKAAKLSPQAVAYQSTPRGDRRCGNCALFEAPSGCRSVAGAVSPQGSCGIWVKRA